MSSAEPALRARTRPWYFCLNEEAIPAYWRLAAVAVLSALDKTDLSPVCLFDGGSGPFTEWLEGLGVEVIHHRVPYWRDLEAAIADPRRQFDLSAAQARGCFLRCEVARFEKGPIALYTDVDVMFLRSVPYLEDVGGVLAACPPVNWRAFESGRLEFADGRFNSGVMFYDVERFRAGYDEFVAVCRAKRFDFSSYDQAALNLVYGKRWQRLPDTYNWRPYFGTVDGDPLIVHFHGPKGALLKAILKGEPHRMRHWVERQRPLYEEALAAADSYLQSAGGRALARALRGWPK